MTVKIMDHDYGVQGTTPMIHHQCVDGRTTTLLKKDIIVLSTDLNCVRVIVITMKCRIEDSQRHEETTSADVAVAVATTTAVRPRVELNKLDLAKFSVYSASQFTPLNEIFTTFSQFTVVFGISIWSMTICQAGHEVLHLCTTIQQRMPGEQKLVVKAGLILTVKLLVLTTV